MNEDNHDSTFGNPLGFFSPEALSSPIQERNRCPNNLNLARNLPEPLQQLSIPGNAPVSFSEWPEITSSFGGSQSASTTIAQSSQSPQMSNDPADAFPFQSWFQHDQQTSSVEKFLGPASEHPRTTSNSGENQSATTLGAPSSQLQQMGSYPADIFPLQTLFQHDQQTSSGEKFLGPASLHPRTTSNAGENQSATTLGVPSSHPKQTNRIPAEEFSSQTLFQLDQQTSSVEKILAPILLHPETISNFRTFIKNKSASLLGASSSQLQQMGCNRADLLALQTPLQHDQQTLSAKKSLESISQHPQSAESVIKNESTSISRKSEALESFPMIVSVLHSPSKREAGELTSPSKQQKTRTLSWSTESQFTSRKNETAIHTRQKTRNLSYPVGTFTSRKKVNDVSFRNKEEKQSTPVMQMSASKEQVTSQRPTQQTGLRQILGRPQSSSPESSLKNPFSKDYKSLQGTGMEKDVDRFGERLKQFEKFSCVICRAKFATQDELLRHEPIHFND